MLRPIVSWSSLLAFILAFASLPAISMAAEPILPRWERIFSFQHGIDETCKQLYPQTLEVHGGELLLLESPGVQPGYNHGWLHVIDTTSLLRTSYRTSPTATVVCGHSYSHIYIADPLKRTLQVIDRSVGSSITHTLPFTPWALLPRSASGEPATVWVTEFERDFQAGRKLLLLDADSGNERKQITLHHVTAPKYLAQCDNRFIACNAPLIGHSQWEVCAADGTPVEHGIHEGRVTRLRCDASRVMIAFSNRAGGGHLEYGGPTASSRQRIATTGRPFDVCYTPLGILSLETIATADNQTRRHLNLYAFDGDKLLAKPQIDLLHDTPNLGAVTMVCYDAITRQLFLLDDRGVLRCQLPKK